MSSAGPEAIVTVGKHLGKAFSVGVGLGIIILLLQALAERSFPPASLTPLDVLEGLVTLAIYGLIAVVIVAGVRRLRRG